MRVVVDSGPLSGGHSVRGVGVSTKGLLESLYKYNTDKNVVIENKDISLSDISDYDIVHYTFFNPFVLNKPRLDCVKSRKVITIHDLIPLIYPSHYPPGMKGSIKYLFNKYLINKVDLIITVSETSKKDIVRFLGVDPRKIEVIYWGIEDSFTKVHDAKELDVIRNKYRLPEKFVLYVGDVNYNKNLSTLILACQKINMRLVVVGKQAANLDDNPELKVSLLRPSDLYRSFRGKTHPEKTHLSVLKNLIKQAGVITTNYVPKEDLSKIYSLATVYCQPSFYEGFGLSVLEAFACETPVVISKTQALIEISNGASLEAEPSSSDDFADKILKLTKDSTERLHLIRAGKNRIKDFTWKQTSVKTLNIYKRILR